MKNIFFLFVFVLFSGCNAIGLIYPPVKTYVAEYQGKAELAHAEYSRQVQIQDAKGKEEAAKHLALAEVTRAEGVAKANQIIGESLKNNEAYLRWLYIEGLKEKQGQEIIYVPTEAGLPILEANRLKK